jgi:hypothetical protein
MSPKKPLKEDRIPVDSNGRPDLSRYRDPPEYYADMYTAYPDSLKSRAADPQESNLAFRRRVHAVWGLIANGTGAIPIALDMLHSSSADAREDGAAILAEIGTDPAVLGHLLKALAEETDTTARDSIVQALGTLKNRKAIPALAALIRDNNTDADTRRTAVESLGRIVRRRFLRQDDPIQAALAWLEGYEKRNA